MVISKKFNLKLSGLNTAINCYFLFFLWNTDGYLNLLVIWFLLFASKVDLFKNLF